MSSRARSWTLSIATTDRGPLGADIGLVKHLPARASGPRGRGTGGGADLRAQTDTVVWCDNERGAGWKSTPAGLEDRAAIVAACVPVFAR